MAFSSDLRSRIAFGAVRGLFFFLVLSTSIESSLAQAISPRMHSLRVGGAELDVLQKPAAPFYDVVALRVEFQPDETSLTSGDGTFSDAIYEGLEVSIDPLPHDAAYFNAHLSFLEHYVERVSDGRTMVTTHLIPEVIRVSQEMAAYSPIGQDSNSDEEMSKLAALVRETWTLASAQSDFDLSGFDPNTTAFLIFHAGAGRDLELTGTTLNRTPQDLPSLFFDEESLERLSPGGDITFNGFPVSSTLLMPETESRVGRDNIADEDFVAEFSINGFLAASFFSFLGVPDLFNTETGESAIGPFGLMDPLGIFAFNGLFPPEPSAWTKQFLGWSNPIEIPISVESQEATVSAVSRFGFSDAVRIPVSGSEYFLVENRQRAAESNEIVLTVFRNGELVEQRIPLNEADFSQFNTRAFEGGVVVAAEPYDWAVPGLSDLGERFDGGIVIWHIDERKIRDGLSSNSVNTDPVHRGVDIEEADGAQDIGFGNAGVANGTPFDYWYLDNPATAITASGAQVQLYENRFGSDTTPSSASSDGGPSFVELSDFTARGSEMSFSVSVAEGASGISAIPSLWREAEVSSTLTGNPRTDHIVYVDDENGGLVAIQGVVGPADTFGGFRLFDVVNGNELLDLDGGQGLAVTPDGYVARILNENGRARIDLIDRSGVAISNTYNFTVEHNSSPGTDLIADGDLFYAKARTIDGVRAARVERALDAWEVVDVGLSGDVQAIAYVDGLGLVASNGTRVHAENGDQWAIPSGAVDEFAMGVDAGGLVGVVQDYFGQSLTWLLPGGLTQPLSLPGEDQFITGKVSLADVDGDQFLDVVTVVNTDVVAYTQSGAMVAGFPIPIPGASISDVSRTEPLVAEFNADGDLAIVVSANGSLHALMPGSAGQSVAGFPLPVGDHIFATPVLSNGNLFGLSSNGWLRAWNLENVGQVFWGQQNGNAAKSGALILDLSTVGPPQSGLLSDTETYNWPNPIREGRTWLRFRTSEDANVSVTIVDLAGAFVEEIEIGDVRGQLPTEVEWVTDAPSGVYFARVTATAGTREESQLIRMAIIR